MNVAGNLCSLMANNGDAALVADYLKSEGVQTLDYVVATHPHEDHVGGLDGVMETQC